MEKPGPLHLAVLLGLAILAVSCGSIFIRLAAAPALAVAAFRLAWAAALLAPLAWLGAAKEWRSLSRRDWFFLVLSGIALAFHFALWIASLSYTSVASSVLLVDTTPFFIGLAGRWVFRQPPTRSFWIGLFVAFAGCVAIFHGDWSATPTSLTGNALAIGGAAAMAVYLLIGGRVRRSLSLLAYVWPVYGSAALVLFWACLLAATPVSGYSARSHLFFFLLGLVPQCVGHTTYNWSLRWLAPSIVALVGLAEPVGAGLLAWLILGERLTALKLAGGAVVLLGIYLATRPEKKAAR